MSVMLLQYVIEVDCERDKIKTSNGNSLFCYLFVLAIYNVIKAKL